LAEPLEAVIGYRFRNPGLLKLALSHKSFASESGSGAYNERLEFLGDSILAAVVAHQLFDEYPDDAEGGLSKKKSLLVSRPS
jgi:ribonuclease-3